MTYSTFIGVLLIAISVAMYYFTNLDYTRFFSDKEFLVGITGGAGIGFILGGFLGWLYKYKSVNKANAEIAAEEKRKVAEQKAQNELAVNQAKIDAQQYKDESGL
ncbi:hypothetical protein SAMN05421738_104147 [Algoriella xinjiangensis]|uniref:Lipopolysaccharide assembly protein A domain-containing protein n=1 Tax=Algoriella xinjiangensis TaxID=684065 RepID=A0A1I4UVM7_9FLAO|nr:MULTISPECIES: hypothetical protein [Algoriella]MBO6213733.1 hypothetical protein [Algoriella sp.]SFM93044.1 hypothetical protein SAMN05421738_104147 [Algoriella xinjiangensis]VDH18138.1 Uncharacterised protein [Algoriella xinjiangensis]